MKTKLVPLALLIPAAVLAQPAPMSSSQGGMPLSQGGMPTMPAPPANPAGQVGATRKPPLESNNGRVENYLPFSSNANASVDGKTIKYESSSGETTSKK